MLPPPPNQFANHNELLAHVRTFAATQGYAVTIKRSRTDMSGQIKNITLCCDRGGSYRNKLNLTANSRHRQTASRLLNCPFELFRIRRDASEDMSGHPIIYRLSTKQQSKFDRCLLLVHILVKFYQLLDK
ncbi:10390_t:CDS:2, partial [Acaulospora morrowiae]